MARIGCLATLVLTTANAQLWFPTLEGLASGRIKPPPGMEVRAGTHHKTYTPPPKK